MQLKPIIRKKSEKHKSRDVLQNNCLILFKSVKPTKDKEIPWNYHRLEETKKAS